MLIEIKNVALKKKNQTILDKVSFMVHAGDCIGVLGPSGAGKSTLFRTLNMMITPTSGEILYNGRNIKDYQPLLLRREIGYILQKPYLFGRTIRDNLEYPFNLLNKDPDWTIINDYLTRVNLPESIADKNTTDLSGGEQQRVALVRSLLVKPKIILLDEVTAALDEENTAVIENLLLTEKAVHKLTVLFITHNNAQAKRLAENILYLDKGAVQFYGTKEDFFQGRDSE